MHKVNVSIPAVSTNVGPGYDVLGLALNLRNTIEMALRKDDKLSVETHGEGKGVLPKDFYNPVMQGAIKLFQHLEQAPAGLAVRCTNAIPLDVGLSSRTALAVGGMVGANNLLGSPFSHEEVIEMATALAGQPESIVTAIRGGLGMVSHAADDTLIYRAIEIAPVRVVLALPELPDFEHQLRNNLPPRVLLADAVHNIGQTALLIEALRNGDSDLLKRALSDRLHEPHRSESISGYTAAVHAANEAGATGVTLCGAGPALLAFADFNHQMIEEAIQQAFNAEEIKVRTWSTSVDMQGVVISVVQ